MNKYQVIDKLEHELIITADYLEASDKAVSLLDDEFCLIAYFTAPISVRLVTKKSEVK